MHTHVGHTRELLCLPDSRTTVSGFSPVQNINTRVYRWMFDEDARIVRLSRVNSVVIEGFSSGRWWLIAPVKNDRIYLLLNALGGIMRTVSGLFSASGWISPRWFIVGKWDFRVVGYCVGNLLVAGLFLASDRFQTRVPVLFNVCLFMFVFNCVWACTLLNGFARFLDLEIFENSSTAPNRDATRICNVDNSIRIWTIFIFPFRHYLNNCSFEALHYASDFHNLL